MSSVLDNPAIRESALRLGVDQYHRLCEAGIIPEKTELLSGIVVSKMGKSPLHTWTVEFLADWLRGCSLDGFSVRVEQPLTLVESEPEPDVAVVEGSRDNYRTSHPVSARLVIEVAVSTEDVDREKTSIYAAAGVSEYWLVLPQQHKVVVFRNPSEGVYAEQSSAELNGTLNWQGATLSLADVFKK